MQLYIKIDLFYFLNLRERIEFDFYITHFFCDQIYVLSRSFGRKELRVDSGDATYYMV